MQTFPVDDPFANVALAAQPTYLQEWIGCEPDNASHLPGSLHDGYFLGPPFNFSSAACTGTDSPPTDATSPRGWIYRRQLVADQKVAAVFQEAQFPNHGGTVLTQANSYAAHVRWALLGRLTAGTIADAGLISVRYVDCTCYEFRAEVTGGTNVVFQVGRYSAGTYTMVAQKVYPGAASLFAFNLPFGMSMKITGSGVTIECVLTKFTLTGSVFTDYNPFKVDGFARSFGSGVTADAAGIITDNGAGKITAAGHAGFVMARDRTKSAIQLVDLCSLVQLQETPFSSYLVEERWQKVPSSFPAIGFEQVTDQFAKVGSILSSAYFHDQFSDVPNWTAELERDSAGQRAKFTPPASPVDQRRVFVARRAADDVRNQHRRVSILLDTTGTAPQKQSAGIALRATPLTAAGQAQAYLAYAWVDHAGGGAKEVRLSRLNGATETILARKTGATFPLNSAFDLELEVYVHLSSPTLDGPAVLIVKQNGTQVVLVAEAIAGIAASAGGTVTDSSAQRILSGPGEAFFVRHEDTTGLGLRTIYFDAWTQLALQAYPSPEDQQASIAVDGEGAAVGSLNDAILAPDFAIELPVEDWPAVLIPFESGHRQSFPEVSSGRRRWGFHKRGVTDSQLATFVTFWDSHLGHEVPFNWTQPGGTAKKCAFVASTYRTRKLHKNSHEVEFELVELLT